ncbi:hypothetical protein BYT27DRAFT_7260192 [Phlegmacium glaucopus]|nr:hypothetical protein BYT27DRAFT_7260192 [Phlegmacium glaucopus]
MAVEMEDYHPEAFDMNDIIQHQKQQERKKLTTDLILEDIEAQHLENVAVVHFLQRLLNFVPALLPYCQKLCEYVASSVSKNQIPKMRCTKVMPLATNSANEMLIQGMKEGILDFASTQMGMKNETLNNMASIWSGDGKTFNMLLSLKKMSAMESNNFHSFQWMIPLLELWHTKWTNLSRIVWTHWGSSDEPNSLATIARLAECPIPSDMRKEWSDLLIDAIQKNWVVNLKGQQGHFIKMDLMQEHFNFWLEDLAQHKGKQFDDVFYCEVLSMNVNNFLNLKDEMEENVTLKRHTKTHGKSSIDNELWVVMNHLREEEVDSFRPGRNIATIDRDDLTEGMKTL